MAENPYASNVDISNRALQELGARLISTMGDNSRNAVQCNFLYDKVRMAELRAHAWVFAITYSTLASAAGTVTYQNGVKKNKFTLPTTYLRFADQNPRYTGVYRQNTTGGMKFTDYSIEGGFLVTSLSAPVILRFVQDFQTVSGMDPMFCEAVAARMALGMCRMLTQNPQTFQEIAGWYTQTIANAKLIDLIESGSDEPDEQETKTSSVNVKAPPPAAQPIRVQR